MKPSNEQLQETLLEYLGNPAREPRERVIADLLTTGLREIYSDQTPPTTMEIEEAFWGLVRYGLAFPALHDLMAPIKVYLSELGREGNEAAKEKEFFPDYPPGYKKLLAEKVPLMSKIVERYTREALDAFSKKCYLATTVMLGVAAEAAFIEMAYELCKWLPVEEGKKLKAMLDKPGPGLNKKFDKVQKSLISNKASFPKTLQDALERHLISVGDTFRIYRNTAGHPTGTHFSKEDCNLSLRCFPTYIERLYLLGDFFS